ncbi:ferric reductase like transmembrane component [Paraphaeosphaeria sporulosa]
MHPLSIYALSFASAVIVLFIWRIWRLINRSTRTAIMLFIRKRLLYALLVRRLRTSSDISVLAGLNLFLCGAANVTACTLWVPNPAEIAKRCGTLFIINVIPLYLGGRTNYIADKILRLQLNEYALLHRWMGRICVAQGLVHGFVNAATSRAPIVETTLLSLVVALGCLSFMHLRRYMYEVFLKTHLLFALALAVVLWFHVRRSSTRASVCLGAASAAWLLQHVIWLVRLIHQTSGSRSTPIDLGPGQYIYITLPRLSLHTLGLIQSHPYVIAWIDGQDITILVERNKGFSNAIFALPTATTHSAMVDGPYGRVQSLGQYDKVLLLASGIGVAAHVLHIRHLLEAHKDKSVRVRRVALTWFLETPEQERWADKFLKRLRDIDSNNTYGRQIFVLKKYIPGAVEYQSQDLRYSITPTVLDLSAEIDGEAGVEGGNTAVLVCGNPHFENAVRKGVRSSKRDIHLFMTGFRPEESEAGKAARGRYC